MTDFNRVTFIGRLTDKPEYNEQIGTGVASGSIAVNKKWKDKDGEAQEYTSFFDFKMWGKSGAVFAEHHSKGDLVLLFGEMRQERWEKDGNNRSKVLIDAKGFEFMPRKQREEGEEGPEGAEATEY